MNVAAESRHLVNLNELLALDDNAEALGLFGRIADHLGYCYIGAENFPKFKTAYLHSRPSLILLDVVIGAGDCGEVIDFLARCRCVVPIVLVTGYNEDYMALLDGRMKMAGLRLAGKVEKRRDVAQLETLMRNLRIPEVEEPQPHPG